MKKTQINLIPKKLKSYELQASKGFITLITVLVVGAVALAISTSLLLMGLSSSRTSFAIVQSSQARALANACAEFALDNVRRSLLFQGSGTSSFPLGYCTYQVTSGVGQVRTVLATGTAGTIIRKVRVDVTRITPTIIASYREIQ